MANADSTTALYGGRHTVTFKNNTHKYLVDGKPVKGVTTIMNAVLAKPGLMTWPLNMAIDHLSALVDDAHIILHEDLEDARKAHAQKRDKGGDVGTIVHELVEGILQTGNVFVDGTVPHPDEVALAVAGFQKWYMEVNPKTIAVEQVVYSEAYNYAGTFDSILKIDGKTYLCDLKTSNASRDAPQGVYAENFIQLGGYYAAYEEERFITSADWSPGGESTMAKIDDLMIISCRKDGKVDTVTASQLGFTPTDCGKLWDSTLHLYGNLTGIKETLKAGVPA